jgi:hypothetical protein
MGASLGMHGRGDHNAEMTILEADLAPERLTSTRI